MKKLSFFFMSVGLMMAHAQNQPTTNAPVPTKDQANVVSVFSDSYTSIATNFNPSWGQSGQVTTGFEAVAGSNNTILEYSGFNYQGTEVTSMDLSEMEYLHIDVWVPAGTERLLKVTPINKGTGVGDLLVNVPLTPGSWSSIDLPKSSFTGMNWDLVYQLKFDGQFNTNGSANTSPWNVFLDNIYFWKTDSTQNTKLSDLKVNGTTISGFSPNISSYTYEVQPGTTTIPSVTATTQLPTSTVIITPATSIPGDTKITVTAQDGVTTKTYTVSFVAIAAPVTAAPVPPQRPAADVVSIFSNAYPNISSSVNTFGDAQIKDINIEGNQTTRLTFSSPGSGYQYITTPIDLSTFTTMHFDVWIAGDPQPGQVVQLIVQNFNEDSSVKSYFYNAEVTVIGSENWYSVDVPLDNFVTGLRNNVKQIQVVGAGPSAFGPTYVDNIYFHKNTLGIAGVAKQAIAFYPNPVVSGQNVTIATQVKNIEVFTMAGQRLKVSSTSELNTSGLAKGVYILKITDSKGAVQSSKLIVK